MSDTREIDLAGRPVGPERACLVIGEVAQAHDGSLGTAHAFIDAIAKAGADAVKFQTHIAAAESTPDEPWRVRFSPQDETRYDYWRRMEWSAEQWRALKAHAESKGLLFLSSPFSLEAVELLEGIGMAAWKVASGEVASPQLLARLIDTGKPVLLSTGMSTVEEIDRVMAALADRQVPRAVLQCTSAYPCPPERVGLNLVPVFRRRYRCAVGLSDHSGTIYPGLAGAALGLEVLEVHVTLDRRMFGPDVPVSVTVEELRQLVEGVRFIERMGRHPVDKTVLAPELAAMRRTFTKSVVAARDLDAGTVLENRHLALKKPGGGIPARRLEELIGRRLRRAVARDQALHRDHLEPS